ncbi:hypothetical protein [Cytobacillus solani]|uniref:hypothetical protein n=2 Tax=Cytobacillus solani TaxID=1637975 RepID=UPI001BA813EB|nr:hypothetical protein [Cytobacillus solani]
MMKKIQCLKELNEIKGEFPDALIEYLMNEFYSLYEYLSNGQKIEEFMLPAYQVMVIIESQRELNTLLKRFWELEFVDEISLVNMTIKRIGINSLEDIQLNYVIKSYNIRTTKFNQIFLTILENKW